MPLAKWDCSTTFQSGEKKQTPQRKRRIERPRPLDTSLTLRSLFLLSRLKRSTTVPLSQGHSSREGFSGSIFDQSPQRGNEPLETSHLLSGTVVVGNVGK